MRRSVIKSLIRRKTFVCILVAALVVCGGLTWRFTYANVIWRLQRTFPGAQLRIVHDFIPGSMLRARIEWAVAPFYIPTKKPFQFLLTDSPELLDLKDRFSRLSKLEVRRARFTRCRIVNLGDLDSVGFRGSILFEDCDFSQLPQEQRGLIRPADPSNPAKSREFYFVGGI